MVAAQIVHRVDVALSAPPMAAAFEATVMAALPI
jgi:hypothetical protein